MPHSAIIDVILLFYLQFTSLLNSALVVSHTVLNYSFMVMQEIHIPTVFIVTFYNKQRYLIERLVRQSSLANFSESVKVNS